MSNLKWLDMSDCTGVTDIGIEALGAGCPALVTLSLTGVRAVR